MRGRCFIGSRMVFGVALPPIGLAQIAKELIPLSIESLPVGDEVNRMGSLFTLPVELDQVNPGLAASPRPINGRIYFEQLVQHAQALGSPIDHEPRARPRRVHLAVVLRCAATQAVSQALGAGQGTDEGGFLEQAIAAHAAAEKDALQAAFAGSECSDPGGDIIPAERVEGGLITSWRENWHGCLRPGRTQNLPALLPLGGRRAAQARTDGIGARSTDNIVLPARSACQSANVLAGGVRMSPSPAGVWCTHPLR